MGPTSIDPAAADDLPLPVDLVTFLLQQPCPVGIVEILATGRQRDGIARCTTVETAAVPATTTANSPSFVLISVIFLIVIFNNRPTFIILRLSSTHYAQNRAERLEYSSRMSPMELEAEREAEMNSSMV
ncbi:hypothetical protein B0H13DRAFT_2348439 [Mycena leptocephala]|nr:hypothetical protein B0H13DRAFT_2348439 [Mycena leptocephala]